jgi:cytochrome P450
MTPPTGYSLDSAPGPKGYPFLGNIFDIRNDNLGFFLDSVRKYGDQVLLRFGPMKVLLITQPKDVKHVLQENSKNYSKEGYGYDQLRAFLGRGLIFNEGGDFWRRQRKLTQAAFHMESLKGFIDEFNRSSSQMIARWERVEAEGKELDILPEMMKVTLQIIGRTLLSHDLIGDAKDVGGALSVVLEEIDRRTRLLTPITNYLPTPWNFKVRRSKRILDNLVYKIIAERKTQGAHAHRDLLAMYMNAVDEETGTGMTDLQLRDEVMNIFIAGHETTANALTWLWLLLSQNPDVEKKIRAEVDEVLGGRAPGLEDFAKLKFTEMAFLETLRLYPPIWVIVRRSTSADQIGDCQIPAGATIFLSPYLTQRHPGLWKDPEIFRPERFANEAASSGARFEFFPFASGPRVCIGQRFATMEALTIIARVMQKFELERTSPLPVEMSPGITLRAKSHIRFRLRSR